MRTKSWINVQAYTVLRNVNTISPNLIFVIHVPAHRLCFEPPEITRPKFCVAITPPLNIIYNPPPPISLLRPALTIPKMKRESVVPVCKCSSKRYYFGRPNLHLSIITTIVYGYWWSEKWHHTNTSRRTRTHAPPCTSHASSNWHLRWNFNVSGPRCAVRCNILNIH